MFIIAVTLVIIVSNVEKGNTILPEDQGAKDGLQRAIEDLTEAGFDVRESLIGWFTVDEAIVNQRGPINDEYCWDSDHTGGWCCLECRGIPPGLR